jgi:hypothetical protein
MTDSEEDFKRQPEYAEVQIRALMLDLARDYNQQLRGVSKFKEYVAKYKPEVYDDDADLLFRGGRIDRGNVRGLLYWSGVLSSKHPGKFKRICLPALSLLHFVVDMDYGQNEANIFYSRFVCCPVAELKKANFDKHIMSKNGDEDVLQCVELLNLIRNDHRSEDGGLEPVEIDEIILENESREIFNQWLRSTGICIIIIAREINRC